MKTKYTFDDILLVPSHANGIDTREDGKCTKTKLFDFKLDIPIIASPMDSLTERAMMEAMQKNGAIGIHHRYCELPVLENSASYQDGGIAISPSISPDFVAKIHEKYPKTFFCLDVAHGDTSKNISYCKSLIGLGVRNIISGNICTPSAAHNYLSAGVSYLRVGVGGGSVCLTRVVTGFGYPQGSAIADIREKFPEDAKIISDGGHNVTGDIVKALALGADYVMLGRMLVSKQCPIPGVYRGMASKEALETRKKEFFVEGTQVMADQGRDVSEILVEIKSAIQTACYYGGCDNFKELVEVDKVIITPRGYVEGGVR